MEDIEKINIGKIYKDIDAKTISSFKISSKISYLVEPDSIESLVKLLKYIKEHNLKYYIIGGATNILFAKPYYRGILIRLDFLNNTKYTTKEVTVGASVSTSRLGLELSEKGYKNFEFMATIPGTIGGAVIGNAGCFGTEVKDVLKKIRVLTSDFRVEDWDQEKLEFSHRKSYFKTHPENICLSATFNLEFGNKEEIISKIKENRKKRLDTQPLEFPSVGSIFRNPQGLSAGKLIDDLGFKGFTIGGAMVSHKHANIIVNNGNATGSDVLNLIEKIKEEVKKNYNIDLECEIIILK